MKKLKNILLITFLLILISVLFPIITKATITYDKTILLNSPAQVSIVTDNNYLYSSNWKEPGIFFKYELDGTFIESFTIENIGGVRNLTFDGTYFYGSDTSSNLYKLDLSNQTLISTINTEVSSIRHCSYDSIQDGFWVGSWYDLYFINKEGTIVKNANISINSAYGSAFDNFSTNSPYLWLFCQNGNNRFSLCKYDINNDTILNETYDISNDYTYPNGSLAGGSFIGEYEDNYSLLLNIQAEPNIISFYTLAEIPKHTITANNITNGFVSFNKSQEREGKLITITVSANDGYALKNLSGIEMTKLDDTTYTFVMPNEDVSINAEFEKIIVEKEEKEEKDITPKTGNAINIQLAIFIVATSILGLTILIKKH